MLKKVGIGIVALAVVLCMTTGIGMAEQPSSSGSVKEILDELKILWEDFAQLKEITTEGIKERLEVARAKEEVLYKLALWQGKLVSELIAEASVRITRITKVEEQVEEQAKINKELQASIEEQAKINKELQASIEEQAKIDKELQASIEEQAKIDKELQASIEEQAKINKELQASIEELKDKVKSLENEVSLAKEIAAAAQIRADQAIAEMKDFRKEAQQTEEKIAVLMATVNDLVIRVKSLEEELGEKPVIKLKTLEPKEISVK